MSIDKIKQQEGQPSIQRVSDMLKRVIVPEKDDCQWAAIESGLFGRLSGLAETATKHTPLFPSFLKPFAFATGFAVVALATAGYLIALNNAKSDISARPLCIHGKVVVASHPTAIGDTLTGIDGFKKLIPLKKGSTVTTFDNSDFIIRLDKGSALEVSPASRMTIDAFSTKRIAITLIRGTLLVKVSRRTKDQKFVITTPAASCVVVGTIFKVDVLNAAQDSPKTVLTVYKGNVRFDGTDARSKQSLYVATGQSCRAFAGTVGPVKGISDKETPLKAISTLELLAGRDSDREQKMGLIDITSQPGEASVILDDSLVGKTPLLIRKPVGSHSVTILVAGCSPWKSNIDVQQDSTITVSARLISGVTKRKGTIVKKAARVPMVKAAPESTLVALPDYIEAMIQITTGEYQKSMAILQAISDNQPLDLKGRKSIVRKINECYAKLGDFSEAFDNLKKKYAKAAAMDAKESYLWEMANMQSNCMGDFKGAENSLIKLLESNPSGIRVREAYPKLAEVRYMQQKFDSAAVTYKVFLQKFPDDPDRDKILFYLAGIYEDDLNNCKEAMRLYSQVINDYPLRNYYEAALFSRGECAAKLGRASEARKDYAQYLAVSPQGLWSAACSQRLRSIK